MFDFPGQCPLCTNWFSSIIFVNFFGTPCRSKIQNLKLQSLPDCWVWNIPVLKRQTFCILSKTCVRVHWTIMSRTAVIWNLVFCKWRGSSANVMLKICKLVDLDKFDLKIGINLFSLSLSLSLFLFCLLFSPPCLSLLFLLFPKSFFVKKKW